MGWKSLAGAMLRPPLVLIMPSETDVALKAISGYGGIGSEISG